MIQKLIFHKHLEEGEKIVYAVHKHWIEMVQPTFVLLFFGLLIPWVFYAIGFNTVVFLWVALAWCFLAFLRFLYAFVDWYTDAFLITNMAIVWVEWGGFFKNAATRMGFEDVEGVAYEINGFWPTVLGYGKVNLKSVSGNVLTLNPARKPKQVELAIMKHQQTYMKDREMEDVGKLKQLLSQMVSSHFRRESK
jgi:hypothetical protein